MSGQPPAMPTTAVSPTHNLSPGLEPKWYLAFLPGYRLDIWQTCNSAASPSDPAQFISRTSKRIEESIEFSQSLDTNLNSTVNSDVSSSSTDSNTPKSIERSDASVSPGDADDYATESSSDEDARAPMVGLVLSGGRQFPLLSPEIQETQPGLDRSIRSIYRSHLQGRAW